MMDRGFSGDVGRRVGPDTYATYSAEPRQKGTDTGRETEVESAQEGRQLYRAAIALVLGDP